ncbi:hypothetical protein LF937_22255, partial [Pectobacterium versatile]|nr:hypothetical protein [Pectobacterium versatile]MCH5085622.1 hypothetical protein [Pectobacterium versatile]
AQSGRNAVENNALSDIIENKVSGISQEEKYQSAQKQLVAMVEEFKAQNCAGLSAEACSTKISEHRNELLKGAAGFGLDFVPVVGDIKGFAEAQSAIDYLAAMVGLIPIAGDAAGKAIKAAEVALKKGDVAEASKLINKASDEIAGSVAHTGAAVNLDEVNRLKFDPHAGKNKLAEGSAATELQNTMGGKLERVDPDASGADFVFSSGPNKGKTVDFMFTTAKGSEKEIEGMNKFFNNNWDNNVKTLHQHLEKADIVPLDFRNLTPANQQRILEYLNALPASQKNQIVIMR